MSGEVLFTGEGPLAVFAIEDAQVPGGRFGAIAAVGQWRESGGIVEPQRRKRGQVVLV